jgi:RNA polymerase sigma factor (sigma-70 family)
VDSLKLKEHSVGCRLDSYCKKVLKNELRNYLRDLRNRQKYEILLSDISDEAVDNIAVTDEYPSDNTIFNVCDYGVTVKNGLLADAMAELPKDRRDIVLLSYYLDMTDYEIAAKLNLVRSTVQYKRSNSLEILKKIIQGAI